MSPVPPSPLTTVQIEQENAQTLAALRQALLKGSAIAVGGRSMDITSSTHSRTPRGPFGGSANSVPSPHWEQLIRVQQKDLSPISPRRSHSQLSSFSSGILSTFRSPFGGTGPVSAPVTHTNASLSHYGQQQIQCASRNCTASARGVPSAASRWPSAPLANHRPLASAGLEPSASFGTSFPPPSSPSPWVVDTKCDDA
ncbi:hypothetical protein F5880DRAFT_1615695 [Lentinula raphanica]|nr:hypothetical protein F5880DRAFT_1615695 [Lentinula raphanica]